MADPFPPITGETPGNTRAAAGSFTALCACLAATACCGIAALSLAFAVYVPPGPAVAPPVLAGLHVMGASLIALPGILAGEKKSAIFLAICGICAAVSFTPVLPQLLSGGARLYSGALAVYGVALATAVILTRRGVPRPADISRFSPLAAWTLVPALAFGLMAVGMAHETTVTQGMPWAAKSAGSGAALLCFLAFFGALRPRLYTSAIHAALLFICVPAIATGIEAHAHADGINLPPGVYAANGWQRNLALCGLAFTGTVRMISLRRSLLPGKPHTPCPSE